MQKQETQNNRHKVELWLLNGSYSVSDIQDCIGYMIRKYEKLHTYTPIHVYINRISNRLVFKIRNKVELQTPKTVKLFEGTK